MASYHCNSGDVFSKYTDCYGVCTGLYSVGKENRSTFHDKVFKVVDFYPDEYEINNDGALFISQQNHFLPNTYIHTNSGVTVCLPMDDCFSSFKYWLVERENFHFLSNNRQLWVKSIRQLASFGEFYIKDNLAVVCHPKLSETPLRIYNGVLCILSCLLLCSLLIYLKLKLNKSGMTIFPLTLLCGDILQTWNYIFTCPKPLLFLLEKYFFISAFLWMNFQTFQLYQKLRSNNTSHFFRFHSNKYLPFVVSLLPLWLERLCSCNTIHFFHDSCEFLLTYGLYLSSILHGFMVCVIILNSIVLRFIKLELFQRQSQDSTLCEQFYLYGHLTIISGIYSIIKLITGIIAIEEVNSIWFYFDVLCQAFGGVVVIVHYNRLITW